MRQIGAFPAESEAARFAAYLVTQGMEAHAERDDQGWAVWVRDENHVDRARELLGQFQKDPNHSRYADAERAAADLRRDRERRRRKAAEKVVQMRDRWRRPAVQRTPLTAALIGLSVLTAVLTGGLFGRDPSASRVFRQLSFCDPIHLNQDDWSGDPLTDIKSGQLWRLITPVFIHYGLIHLLFNMYMLHYLGGQVEARRGSLSYFWLVLAIALISNAAQALGSGPWFGGMSGVDYGLFGYVWMKTLYAPQEGMHVSQATVMILIAWFFLCLAGVIGNVANVAHGAGLAAGVGLGYASTLLPRRSG